MSPILYHLESPAPNVNIQHVDQERIKGQGGEIAGTDGKWEMDGRWDSSWGGQYRGGGEGQITTELFDNASRNRITYIDIKLYAAHK